MKGNSLRQHWQTLILVPILALAFFMAYIPHRDYAYPVHLDDWQVMVFTNELMEKGSTAELTNPVYEADWLVGNQTGELGDHIFWSAFREITGMDWLPVFRYFPGIIFMMAVLGVFVLAHRQGFGWQAALLASLIPTTTGILGPAFLVPVALAMVFLPLTLFTVFYLRGWRTYLLLALLMAAPAAIHPPTAAGLLVVLVPYGLLCLRREPKHSLGMALAVGLPFIALFPVIYRMALPYVNRLAAEQAVSRYVYLPTIIQELGYVTAALFILGMIYLAWQGKKEGYGLALGTGMILVMLAVFYTLHYGVDIVYYRGLLVGMLLMSVLAGAGMKAISRASPLFKGRLRGIFRHLRLPAVALIVVLVLVTTIMTRLQEPYYHMVEAADYRAFRWIGEYLGEGKGLVDPWQGMAFAGVTGKQVYSFIGETPDGNAEAAYEFLNNAGTDSNFLVDNKIDTVYTKGRVENPDLNEVRGGVYIRKK